MAEDIARTKRLEAASLRNGTGKIYRYERSNLGRIESCFSDCSGNACGTWTGIAWSCHETSQFNDMSNMPKMLPETSLQTVPSKFGDVPEIYTQRTDGLPTFKSGSRRLEHGSAQIVVGVDESLLIHARLSQTIILEGASIGDLQNNQLRTRSALAETFGVATHEVLISKISPRENAATYNLTQDVLYYIQIKSTELETVIGRMKTVKQAMSDAISSDDAKNTLTPRLQAVISKAPLRLSLSPVVLETHGTSPEVFARLALGGAEYTCSACQCKCATGFTGANCALRSCPTGRSWFSLPTGQNVGHPSDAVCSDAGICDENSGTCSCREGFTGRACERLACPLGDSSSSGANVCSGHGECLSMRMAAQRASLDSGLNAILYGTDPNSGDAWDADHVYGCHCDDGFTGYDCSLRDCDRGDDPRTTSQNFETQVFRCIKYSSDPPDGQIRQALDTGTNEISSALDNVKITADVPSSMTSFFRLSYREKTPAAFYQVRLLLS